jgi:hypothetical protein
MFTRNLFAVAQGSQGGHTDKVSEFKAQNLKINITEYKRVVVRTK